MFGKKWVNILNGSTNCCDKNCHLSVGRHREKQHGKSSLLQVLQVNVNVHFAICTV